MHRKLIDYVDANEVDLRPAAREALKRLEDA
jgi:hypothetical protein